MADAPRSRPPPSPSDAAAQDAVQSSGSPPAPPRDASVLDKIERLRGAAPKILLRDSPSEHGGSPIVDASSQEVRQVRQLPPGRGNYELLGEIAHGGMGVILKGHDRDLGRDVAVKVLKKDLTKKDEIVQRFIEEAQIGGQLQHPGIVPVYELGLLADERPYFTMKLVKGRTLAALLTERTESCGDRCHFLGIFEQVCQTMAYAHSRLVIHRDLKPANVMVGAFGEVQVLDWGLAKVLAQGGVADEKKAGREHVSHASIISTVRHKPGQFGQLGSSGSDSLAGSVMGTPAYMPPEQARGEIDRLDERSDVFSLGAMLCEILTGKPPYTGDPTEQVEHAANAELAEATLRLETSDADPELVALTKRCLAPAPSARPRNAGVVAKELASWRASVEERATTAQISAAESRGKAEQERRARRMTLALSAVVVFLLVAGIGGGALFLQKRQSWQGQTATRVESALAEATLLRGQRKWSEATAAMQQALASLDAGQPTEQLRQHVHEQAATLAKEAEQAGREAESARQNRELVNELTSLRIAGASIAEESTLAELDTSYVDTFSAYGLALDDLAPDEAARLLRERGLAEPAAAALDDWIYVRRRLDRRDDVDHLVAIQRQVDPDPKRVRLRDAIRIGDRQLLREFVREEDLAALPASSLALLATAFDRIDLQREAIGILRIGQAAHPEDFVLNVNLGIALRGLREPEVDEAMRSFTAALAVRPDDAVTRAIIGMMYVIDFGEPARGLEMLGRAAREAPKEEIVRLWYARALQSLERTEEAIEQRREVARLAPRDSDAHSGLALVLLNQGDAAAAMESARESLRLNPLNVWAHVAAIESLLVRGDIDGAASALANAEELGLRGVVFSAQLARIRSLRGDREGARAALARMPDAAGNSLEFQFQLAWELAVFPDPTLRDAASILDIARRGLARAPRRAEFNSLLGCGLCAAGDWKGAIEALERSAALTDGGTPFDWIFLAMAHQRLGDHDEAVRWHQKAADWMTAHRNRRAETLRLLEESRKLLGIAAGESR